MPPRTASHRSSSRWYNAVRANACGCAATGLAILASHTCCANSYVCEGSGCCDAPCGPGEDCRQTPLGALVPRWWPRDSCEQLIAAKHDASILCAQALQPYEACGLTESFACGYGLACVAESITYAHCAPICSWSFKDEFLHLKAVAAGCKHNPQDGQRGIMNHDAADEYVPVGKVLYVTDEIVVPACVAKRNLAQIDNADLDRTEVAVGFRDGGTRADQLGGAALGSAVGVLEKARRLLDPQNPATRPNSAANAAAEATPAGTPSLAAHSQASRGELAAQVIGLNLQFHEVRPNAFD